MSKAKTKEEHAADEKLKFIDLVGAFTSLSMKEGGCKKFVYWVNDPEKEIYNLVKFANHEAAAEQILEALALANGKAHIPIHGRVLRLAFGDKSDSIVFTKDGVIVSDLYFCKKQGKNGPEVLASITFEILDMGKEFQTLCDYCSKGLDTWLKICEPQGEMFND